jgi:ABC-type Fe3+ transport system substrate-binding protein
MKIHEAVLLAESLRLFVRFVISRENEKVFAERLQNRRAAFEPLAKIAEIARSDVNVGGLRDDAFKGAQVAVNIAEN